MPVETFYPLSSNDLASIFRKLNKTTCVFTKLMMSHLSSIIDSILHIANTCLSFDVFQHLVSPQSFFL